MAYNSDGYIMIDFTEVDFRRTNQTIDGLYKRCVDVIGTNKFILVINANGRTPLPATCSFTNNQYVIDTCIYMFAISSNDNLFIRRNDVPASDIIDDSSISVDKTWSSNKIDTELDGKQNTLTAGTNITIDENNVISSTGGAVIDDNVIVNNKVWSSLNTVEMLAPIDTVVGNPATFDTSLALPVVECSTSITATQDGTGDPSPSNPRSIVGVDDITLTINGNSVVIDLDGTRYGAEVDVVNGVAHITHKKDKISSLRNIQYDTNNQCFYGYKDDIFVYSGTGLDVDVKCEIYRTQKTTPWVYWSNVPTNSIGVRATSTYVVIKDIRFNNVADLISGVGDEVFTYPLAEPFDIQLTPTQIETLIGNNSFASDTGSIKVSYKCLPSDLL